MIGDNGWGSFRSVFSGGDGIIYAITTDGNLVFYRDHSRSGTGDSSAPSSELYALFVLARVLIVLSRPSFAVIGRGGWHKFLNVFYGGNGIIYGAGRSTRWLPTSAKSCAL